MCFIMQVASICFSHAYSVVAIIALYLSILFKYVHRMAFIVSSSNMGDGPFFPFTVEHLNSSSEKSSSISSLRRCVVCLFDFKIVASHEPLIKIPVFLTSSIFCTGAYNHRNVILVKMLYVRIPFLFLHQILWLPT